MADWFIAFNGESLGPISAAELKQRALAGEISPETQICKAGTNKWAPASALKGLFPAMAADGTAAKNLVAVKPPATPASPPLAPTPAIIVAQPQPTQAEVVQKPMLIAHSPVFAQPMPPSIAHSVFLFS